MKNALIAFSNNIVSIFFEIIPDKICLKIKEILISIARVRQKIRGNRNIPRICKRPMQHNKFQKSAKVKSP
jgi:hypothetical protein